jgi:hypothetical protein
MNFEQQIKEMSSSNINLIDENIFLEKLHSERKRRVLNNNRILNGLSAGILVLFFSWASFSQLTDDPAVYVSIDLQPIEFMDIESETYVYELADYLLETSDDLWETLAFLDEINFENLDTKNNGGLE